MKDVQVKKHSLPYRKGVQAYIIKDNKILIVTEIEFPKFWKVPSGGMDPGEKPEETVKREMHEELNIHIDIIKKCSFKNKYYWPDNVVKRSGYKYKGQEQYIFIAQMKEGEKIKHNQKEIKSCKWIKFREINKYFSIDSQKKMAVKVLNEYKRLKKNNLIK
ncbi:MAG TPA: NUDIX domain-containing protein [Alphaproteobacteria bacterium]|nr:NUDIX domain-containing protein [Alphaproteobacteria bacterium]